MQRQVAARLPSVSQRGHLRVGQDALTLRLRCAMPLRAPLSRTGSSYSTVTRRLAVYGVGDALRRGALLLGVPNPRLGIHGNVLYSTQQWAVIDTHPVVMVPVPTTWQKVYSLLAKLFSVWLGVAVISAATYAIYVLQHGSKWGLLLVFPIQLWASYKLFISGAYKTVAQYAQIRNECASLPFSQAIEKDGVFEVMTPSELRRKFLYEASIATSPVEFVTSPRWDFASLRKNGVFMTEEVEIIGQLRLKKQQRDAALKQATDELMRAFDGKVSFAQSERDRIIEKAHVEWANSAEVRLEQELNSTFQKQVKELDDWYDAKFKKIDSRNYTPPQKDAQISALAKEYNLKKEHARTVHQVKVSENAPRLYKLAERRDAKIKEAKTVYEKVHATIKESEGLDQKLAAVQEDFQRQLAQLDAEWLARRAVIVRNDSLIKDSLAAQ